MPLSWPERLAPPVASKCQSGLQVSRAEMSLSSENLLLLISHVITSTFTYTSELIVGDTILTFYMSRPATNMTILYAESYNVCDYFV